MNPKWQNTFPFKLCTIIINHVMWMVIMSVYKYMYMYLSANGRQLLKLCNKNGKWMNDWTNKQMNKQTKRTQKWTTVKHKHKRNHTSVLDEQEAYLMFCLFFFIIFFCVFFCFFFDFWIKNFVTIFLRIGFWYFMTLRKFPWQMVIFHVNIYIYIFIFWWWMGKNLRKNQEKREKKRIFVE